MLVKDIMTTNVLAIDPHTSIGDVSALMEQRNIRHFPILEAQTAKTSTNHSRGQRSPADSRLVGIVSDRDIRGITSRRDETGKAVALDDPVHTIMIRDVLTAHPKDPIEEAAKVLREYKIGAMPVLEESTLVGIVTAIDFLDALVRMTGVHEVGTRLEVELPNRPGALAGLLARIASHNLSVSSTMTTRADTEHVSVVLRANTIDGHGLATHLRQDGFTVLWPLEKHTLP
ncbi:MAG: CBS domain-containing protein [Trueperaceae bacterium]|nr:MAG: CBS domain-containing protein [Trueperaceae bacterium]